jgi:hypothetical protein
MDARQSFLSAAALLILVHAGSCGGKVEPASGTAGSGGAGVGGGAGIGGAPGTGGGYDGGAGKGGAGGTSWDGGSGWGGNAGKDGGPGKGGAGGTGWDGGMLYGMITDIKFSTPFLLDSDKLYDDNYVQQHPESVLYGAAFFGYYGTTSKPIPPSAGQTLTYGTHSPAEGGYPPSVQVSQYAIGYNSDIVSPLVQFYFASDKIQVGTLSVGLSPGVGAYLVLYNSLDEGADYCAIAIAGGSVQVLEAVNTWAPDGGKLQFIGSNLPLYHPKQTPWGDVTQYLGSVCPLE